MNKINNAIRDIFISLIPLFSNFFMNICAVIFSSSLISSIFKFIFLDFSCGVEVPIFDIFLLI
jgi:hypothetical protein